MLGRRRKNQTKILIIGRCPTHFYLLILSACVSIVRMPCALRISMCSHYNDAMCFKDCWEHLICFHYLREINFSPRCFNSLNPTMRLTSLSAVSTDLIQLNLNKLLVYTSADKITTDNCLKWTAVINITVFQFLISIFLSYTSQNN